MQRHGEFTSRTCLSLYNHSEVQLTYFQSEVTICFTFFDRFCSLSVPLFELLQFRIKGKETEGIKRINTEGD
jgi:hypothetical protein